MKVTLYYQFAGNLGGGRNDPDRVWWPDQCAEVIVDMKPKVLNGVELPLDYMDADLEAAAVAVCLQEYRRYRGGSTAPTNDGDKIRVCVSRSPNEPGRQYWVRLDLEPTAVAWVDEKAKSVRLPTEAEKTEVEAA